MEGTGEINSYLSKQKSINHLQTMNLKSEKLFIALSIVFFSFGVSFLFLLPFNVLTLFYNLLSIGLIIFSVWSYKMSVKDLKEHQERLKEIKEIEEYLLFEKMQEEPQK
jgi:O-antigen/teichoic acid export membrane protein